MEYVPISGLPGYFSPIQCEKLNSETHHRLKGKHILWNCAVDFSSFPASSLTGTTFHLIPDKIIEELKWFSMHAADIATVIRSTKKKAMQLLAQQEASEESSNSDGYEEDPGELSEELEVAHPAQSGSRNSRPAAGSKRKSTEAASNAKRRKR